MPLGIGDLARLVQTNWEIRKDREKPYGTSKIATPARMVMWKNG
jgi:hypothetical protein